MATNEAKHREALDAFRKAIELNPTNIRSRRTLVGLLLESGDFEGAERVCRDEIQSKPSHQAWAELGLVMESSGRFGEAEESYSRALEFDKGAARTWLRLGRLQFRELKKTEEARISLQKAVDIGGWKSEAWPYLLELQLVQGEGIGSIIEKANRFVQEQGEHPEYINRLAWRFYRSGREDILPEAELLARKAVERMKTGNRQAVYTLAVVLGREGKWHEALAAAASLFNGAAESEAAIRDCIDFAILAASAGHAPDILSVLGESKGRTALEPLEVGLRRFLQETPLTAREISEVANDIVEQIRQKQAAKGVISNRPE